MCPKYPQVERTLQLWADGEMMPLDTASMRKHPNRPSNKATCKLNPLTGVVSKAATNFSAENWVVVTGNYVMSIGNMKAGSLDEVVELATPYMSPLKRRQGSTRNPSGLTEDDEDMRACLADNWHGFSLLSQVSAG
jgi:hypothetical protein